jgi:spermidine/putrescine transport system ATP-binding protein
VAFPLRVVQQTQAVAERVDRVLELVHMQAYAQSYPARLSGGQQQRVALARAIVAEPLLLLLDEPLSALDRKMRTYLQGEIKRLQRRLDRAFLFVTHDQEEAFALSDLVYVMNAGRILQRGSPEEVYSRPADAFVADFIGESSRVPVTIQATDGGNAEVDTPFGTLHVPVHPALAVGDRGVLVLRPENVRISEDTHAALQTRVTDVTFTGADYRIDVNTNGVGLIATAARPVEPGSTAGVRIDPTAAFITREAGD